MRYYPTVGDKHGWAIDEDLRLIRGALEGSARESALWRADVVHAPFWMALAMHDPEVLRRRFVIAHADNPPFFYLTQPEFAAGQRLVDLWVARSREAVGQFAALGLPAVHVPYAIDETLFFPMKNRGDLRRKHGIPDGAYVIGNFHRDSEGSDLERPKFQKSPETFVAILRMVREQGLEPHVLLAGPRRHWIRKALAREGISFTFVGRHDVRGDDMAENILPRERLNELYNACDLYLIASRWEGGPQSAMEAVAARVKILSLPLGVAADILEGESLFDAPLQAAEKIVRDAKENFLGATLDVQRNRLLTKHTAAAMARGLRDVYQALPERMRRDSRFQARRSVAADFSRELLWQLRRRRPRRLPRAVIIRHEPGHDEFLDEAAGNLLRVLGRLGISICADGGEAVIAGYSEGPAQFRILPAGGLDEHPHDPACRVALSAQDAVNFRLSSGRAPVIVCPLIFEADAEGAGEADVDGNGKGASLGIWRCMLGGGAPAYPAGSPYYYQVFHGGIPYGAGRSREDAVEAAMQGRRVLCDLSRPPSEEAAVKFWSKLLSR